MNRMNLLALLLCVAGTISPERSMATNPDDPSPLERLRSAISEHPDDPDLRFAIARRLAIAGQSSEAVRVTRQFVGRWPERRPAARVEIARILIEGEATAEAIELLDEELSAFPQSAMARFYRGLAFRKSGLVAAANREFRIAGRLEPSIRTETLLARALGLFDMGQEKQAVTLLRTILQLDPTGESALRARLILRQREILDLPRRWRVDGYVGFEWDDNVTLESAENEVPASGGDDIRGIWGIGLTGRPWQGERGSLILGYRYDQTRHADLSDFDVLANTIFATGTWRVDDRLVLRLDGVFGNTLQDLDSELFGGSLRPNLIYAFGPEWGAVRIFGQVEISEYQDDPVFGPWERDALTFSVGAEHFLPLRMKGSWLAVSGSWSRTLTQAEPFGAAGGYDGDFDYDSWRFHGTTTLALPFEFQVQLDAAYNHDRYHNDNFAHFLQTLGTGGPRKRRDDVLSGRISLSRRIIDPVRFEIYWRGARRISNVDVFDYDKQIVGALIRFSTDKFPG